MERVTRSGRVVAVAAMVTMVAGGRSRGGSDRYLRVRAPTVAQAPQPCDQLSRSLTLFAAPVSGGRFGFGLRPDKPTIPGPT